jgi:hypothetical protein
MATVAKGKPRAGKGVVAVEPMQTLEEAIEAAKDFVKPETVDQKLERIKVIQDEIKESMPVEFVGRDAELTDQIYGIEKAAPRVRTDVLPEKNGDGTGALGTLQRFINLYQPGEIVSRQMFRNLLLDCLNDWEKR